MTIYEMLCLFGIPTLFGGVLVTVVRYTIGKVRGVQLGVKALLRAQMISEYNKFMEKGYAPIYAKENFQNCWEQYHAIKGPNGVMDDIHEKFMRLPTEILHHKENHYETD